MLLCYARPIATALLTLLSVGTTSTALSFVRTVASLRSGLRLNRSGGTSPPREMCGQLLCDAARAEGVNKRARPRQEGFISRESVENDAQPIDAPDPLQRASPAFAGR